MHKWWLELSIRFLGGSFHPLLLLHLRASVVWYDPCLEIKNAFCYINNIDSWSSIILGILVSVFLINALLFSSKGVVITLMMMK